MIKALILASSSKNRSALLQRLQLDFSVIKPQVDESILPNEKANDLVIRLAKLKANFVEKKIIDNKKIFPPYWIIGSDQVLEIENKIFGKAGTKQKAFEQLKYFSAKKGIFHTSICLIYQNNTNKVCLTDNIKTEIQFKKLSDKQIHNYIDKDNPLDCAASFKSESLGISLIASLKNKDPSSIIGLPLITLCEMLEKTDYCVI